MLFSHLDEVERCEIFDAMFPAFARPGHLIIKQVVVDVAVIDDVYVVLFVFVLGGGDNVVAVVLVLIIFALVAT